MLIMSAEQIRQAEKEFIAGYGDGGLELMRRAGRAVAEEAARGRSADGLKIAVLCGKGNNGGDGYAAAAFLAGSGASIVILEPFGQPGTGIASAFRDEASPIVEFCGADDAAGIIAGADVIIDALFGIGFHGELDGKTSELVSLCNASRAVKIAVDVPSGLCSDSGAIGGVCFKADVTVTFSAYKPCFVLRPAAEFCGRVVPVDIGIPDSVLRGSGFIAGVIDEDLIRAALPVRSRFANKFDFGRAFMMCGSYGMAGAAVIALKAAYRSGAGLVGAAVPDSVYPIVSSRVPEAVFYPYEQPDGDAVDHLIERASKSDAALIGCGLGTGEGVAGAVRKIILNIKIPTVIDADGINALSSGIDIFEQAGAPLILTPHTGEMARLTGLSADEIEGDRINVAARFAARLRSVIVLKGAETVVASPDGRVLVNMAAGNPGMATAGSGDMLAGMICALAAGGSEPFEAAASAVLLHALAGDAAAERLSATSITASDMIDELARLFAKYERVG